jgi:uncharacterized membrane protein
MLTQDSNLTSPERTTSRLEAFSDGVFAVAITLLVLNIQIPHLKDLPPGTTLVSALVAQWPVYLGYVSSFLTIGIVWANHHNTFKAILKINHTLLILNLILMMSVTLIPFTTALLTEYLREPGEPQHTAAAIYALGWLLLGGAYGGVWTHAVNTELVDPHMTGRVRRQVLQRILFGTLFYIVAFVAALFSAELSVLVCVALAIYYLFPAPSLE